MGVGPANDGDVGDGEAVADDEAGGGLLKMGLEGAVETASLVRVTVDAVFDLLGCVTYVLSEWTFFRRVSRWPSSLHSRLKWLACLYAVSIIVV